MWQVSLKTTSETERFLHNPILRWGKSLWKYHKGLQESGPYELAKKQTEVCFQDESLLWEYNPEKDRDGKEKSKIKIKLWVGNEGGSFPKYEAIFCITL